MPSAPTAKPATVKGRHSCSPDTVNADPEASGWFAKLKVSAPAEIDALMDRAAYEQFLQGL